MTRMARAALAAVAVALMAGAPAEAAHRIRVHVLGASAASLPSAPAVNTVAVGGEAGSRLLFPVLPGSNLRAALGGGGR